MAKSTITETGVKIEGLSRAMTQMKKTVGSLDALKGPLQEIADVGARNLRQVTPVRTGTLKGTVTTANTARKARVKIGGRRPRHYAPFVNYGTKRQRAQRFVKKAKLATSWRASRIYETEIKRILRKELGS
ncbi:HK97-gp10 family putative phage morphogenesis protein [uncultured Mobiluncus sp.]|uniref:HK97-gp10 family putative phage morphogenesis protein n=1 Tax=uncultured Mobiluncus sp. TaxID=293425 RepID=UPI002627331A|nr:HK97-gp10 family putative phage morphogenesis protein [uncultured Mobiluncus sp.]